MRIDDLIVKKVFIRYTKEFYKMRHWITILSFWNVTGGSAAMLPGVWQFSQRKLNVVFTPMAWLWDLTHWGRVTNICVSKLTIISSDNGLSPGRRQAIIWANVGILLIGPLGINFSEILIEIPTFPFKKTRLKVSSVNRWPFCLGLNVLTWSKDVVSYANKSITDREGVYQHRD